MATPLNCQPFLKFKKTNFAGRKKTGPAEKENSLLPLRSIVIPGRHILCESRVLNASRVRISRNASPALLFSALPTRRNFSASLSFPFSAPRAREARRWGTGGEAMGRAEGQGLVWAHRGRRGLCNTHRQRVRGGLAPIGEGDGRRARTPRSHRPGGRNAGFEETIPGIP